MEVFFTRAQLVSASEVQCEMPFSIVNIEIHYSSITWLVSVSNDNVTFSGTTSVFVFDSKCLMCTTDTASCQQKVYLCYQAFRYAYDLVTESNVITSSHKCIPVQSSCYVCR